jgi:hypothetical protein
MHSHGDEIAERAERGGRSLRFTHVMRFEETTLRRTPSLEGEDVTVRIYRTRARVKPGHSLGTWKSE